MSCIFGIDIVRGSLHGRRRPKYALYVLGLEDSPTTTTASTSTPASTSTHALTERSASKGRKIEKEFREISRAKLFRLVKSYRPEIIAVDNTSELFSSREELISFLKKLPEVRLVQVAGKYPLPALAKRFGLRIDIRNPLDEAKACAILASFGVGEEVSVFSDKTTITVSRNRSLGKGGWSQNRYRRKVHEEVRRVYREIKEILDEKGFEYEEEVRHGYGGISRGIITVKARRREIPIASFRSGNVQVKVEAVEKDRVEYIPLSKQTTHTIVGVDPGTTTAIAVLDLEGNLLGVRSKKGWSPAEVVEYILSFGKPVIIATDKSNPPDFVSKLRASFNAVLHVPREDTSVERKKHLVSPFRNEISNDHERDALSAAIDAYNAHKSKLLNVEKRIPPGVDVDAVKAGIIRGLTLKELIDRKEEKGDSRSRVRKQSKLEMRELRARDRVIRELEEENRLLRKQVDELREEVERLRSKLVAMAREEHREIRRENYVRSLEAELSELRKLLREKDRIIEELEERVEALKAMKMLEFSGWKSVKLLEKFTRECIEKLEREAGIGEKDVIYIDVSAGGGKSQAEYLCSKGIKAVIAERDKMAHTALEVFYEREIPVIDKDEVDVRVADGFAMVNAEEFERIYERKLEELKKRKVENFEKLILEYKNRFR